MDKQTRRAWSRPELIVLARSRAEEAVLIICKISGGGGGPLAIDNPCTQTGAAAPCDPCEAFMVS